jgi:hypothetical protein
MWTQDVRGRDRNAKKNRSRWAKTSHLRARPRSSEDFTSLEKGRFQWNRDPGSATGRRK